MLRAWTAAQIIKLCAVKTDGKPDVGAELFAFPVPARAMKITQKSKADEAKSPGRSGKIKQAVGFEDAEIEITLTLLDDFRGTKALEKLAQFQAAFHERIEPPKSPSAKKTKAKKPTPRVYSIVSPQTNACGIRTVLFTSLDCDWIGNGSSAINLTLSFKEYEIVLRQAEKRKTTTIDASKTEDGSEMVSSAFYKALGYSEDEAAAKKIAIEEERNRKFRQQYKDMKISSVVSRGWGA